MISGQKFRDYVKDNIFEPLNMLESVYHQTEETLARTASQYTFVTTTGEVLDIVEAQKSGNEKLLVALANYGTGLTREQILSKYSVELMWLWTGCTYPYIAGIKWADIVTGRILTFIRCR